MRKRENDYPLLTAFMNIYKVFLSLLISLSFSDTQSGTANKKAHGSSPCFQYDTHLDFNAFNSLA